MRQVAIKFRNLGENSGKCNAKNVVAKKRYAIILCPNYAGIAFERKKEAKGIIGKESNERKVYKASLWLCRKESTSSS